MRRQLDLGQPAPAALAEHVGQGRLDQVARQDRVDLVAQPGALAHQAGAVRDPPAQRARGLIRRPHLRQEVRRAELREHLGVDLVGLDLRRRDRPRAHRVGHRHPARMLGEQLGDRPRHRRRLQHHVVRPGPNDSANVPQLAGLDPPQPPQPAVLVHRDLREALVHIKRDRPHPAPPSRRRRQRSRGGRATRHLRIRARQAQPDKSKGRPDISTGSHGPYARRPALSLSSPLPLFRSQLLRDRGQRPLLHNRYQCDRASRHRPRPAASQTNKKPRKTGPSVLPP